jgi:cysteinyl-tRNA synthetase
MSKVINRFLSENEVASTKILNKVYEIFSESNKLLGLLQHKKTKDVELKIVDDLIQLLFDVREELRSKGDYESSDKIRARMKKAGLVIEDTKEGPKWKIS